jgi:cell wall-associated NlpC family hydrolase
MTSTRTSSITRRSIRGAALALVTGAAIAVTPLSASASTSVTTGAVTVAAAPVAAPTAAAQAAVNYALAQQGKPYVWGGVGPGGYDCSGLTWAAYQAAGVALPRTSLAQSTVGVPVDRANLQPGDLIFFYSPVGHVGMYIGNGLMVHSSTYGQPIAVIPVDYMYGYNTARRMA